MHVLRACLNFDQTRFSRVPSAHLNLSRDEGERGKREGRVDAHKGSCLNLFKYDEKSNNFEESIKLIQVGMLDKTVMGPCSLLTTPPRAKQNAFCQCILYRMGRLAQPQQMILLPKCVEVIYSIFRVHVYIYYEVARLFEADRAVFLWSVDTVVFANCFRQI
jgi:hypothetical protein